jgi:hypothetical protein
MLQIGGKGLPVSSQNTPRMPLCWRTVDYMLRPSIFREVVKHFDRGFPAVDMFAAAHNCQVPTFWSAQNSAFLHDWSSFPLLWGNPPFHLFPQILHHLLTFGGSILLLAPRWESAALSALRRMASRSFPLPHSRLFLSADGSLLPPPRWDADVLLIEASLLYLFSPSHMPSHPAASVWVPYLPADGDVESNPGPTTPDHTPAFLSWAQKFGPMYIQAMEKADVARLKIGLLQQLDGLALSPQDF